MELNITNNLIELAKSLSSPLYVVGGKVRDTLIGYDNDDIDICSACRVEEVISKCKELKYKVDVINKRLGTLLIRPNEDEHYEYTAFRKENYVRGNHTPSEVEFVEDIKVDASRRDFTINSIYYNVLTKETVDIYGGINDISKKRVKSIETPAKVFSADGLRILRFVRMVSTLGFKAELKTLKTAREMTYQLRDISGERKKKELDYLVVAEKKHGLSKNQFIEIFNKLNIYKHLFLLPCEKYKIRLNNDYKNFFNLDDDKRFIGFMVLFLLNKYDYKPMPHNLIVNDIQHIMGGVLKCSNEEQKQTLNAYLVLQDLKYKLLNNFVAVNYQKLSNFEKFIVNQYVDVKPVSILLVNMINSGIPVSENKLDITNEDIIELLGEKYISKVKHVLLEACLMGKLENNKESLINFIKENILMKK